MKTETKEIFLAVLTSFVFWAFFVFLATVFVVDKTPEKDFVEEVVETKEEENKNERDLRNFVEIEEYFVRKQDIGEFILTAYCSCEKCCGKWALNRPVDDRGNEIVYGASGVRLVPEYSVAVDPSVIPYGTRLYIDGKEFAAHDCGGAIKGNRIDVYFSSHKAALSFGKKTKNVEVAIE